MSGGAKIIQPEGWARPKGYANGIVAEGKVLFIGGQIGWDATRDTPVLPKDFTAQFEAALLNVLTVLKTAGGAPEHLARFTVYVTDRAEYLASTREIGQLWKKHLGRHYPAMALVIVAGLLEPDAKVEIEATAVLPA